MLSNWKQLCYFDEQGLVACKVETGGERLMEIRHALRTRLDSELGFLKQPFVWKLIARIFEYARFQKGFCADFMCHSRGQQDARGGAGAEPTLTIHGLPLPRAALGWWLEVLGGWWLEVLGGHAPSRCLSSAPGGGFPWSRPARCCLPLAIPELPGATICRCRDFASLLPVVTWWHQQKHLWSTGSWHSFQTLTPSPGFWCNRNNTYIQTIVSFQQLPGTLCPLPWQLCQIKPGNQCWIWWDFIFQLLDQNPTWCSPRKVNQVNSGAYWSRHDFSPWVHGAVSPRWCWVRISWALQPFPGRCCARTFSETPGFSLGSWVCRHISFHPAAQKMKEQSLVLCMNWTLLGFLRKLELKEIVLWWGSDASLPGCIFLSSLSILA